MALRKPFKRNQVMPKNNQIGKGFVGLDAFQIKNVGQVPSEFSPGAIKVGPKKPVPSAEKRRLAFNDLSRTTRITNPTLRNAVRERQIYATRASLIQDLLNRGIIGSAVMGDFMHLSKEDFTEEVAKLLLKL
ncbi:MAG: hypothetical protein WC634_03420 [archaeon]